MISSKIASLEARLARLEGKLMSKKAWGKTLEEEVMPQVEAGIADAGGEIVDVKLQKGTHNRCQMTIMTPRGMKSVTWQVFTDYGYNEYLFEVNNKIIPSLDEVSGYELGQYLVLKARG